MKAPTMTSDSLHQALIRAADAAAGTAEAISEAFRRVPKDDHCAAVLCAQLLHDAAKLRERIGQVARDTTPSSCPPT
jgi:hypothetical protein